MLVLSRKPGEAIVINNNIIVRIAEVRGETVRIGVEAPPEIPVHRQEIHDKIQLEIKLKEPPSINNFVPMRRSVE